MAANYVEGYLGKVVAGAVDLNVDGWSGKIETNEVDISTTGDGGWDDAAGTRKKFTFQFNGVWKKSANPYAATPGLIPGAIVDVVELYTDVNQKLTGKALILGVDHKIESADVHRFTVTARNKGPWVLPTV